MGEFAGLELDGGPERKGRRGTPEWVQRIEKNFSSLLAHYLTITFFVVLLHALSHFGLLIWIAGAQARVDVCGRPSGLPSSSVASFHPVLVVDALFHEGVHGDADQFACLRGGAHRRLTVQDQRRAAERSPREQGLVREARDVALLSVASLACP